MVMWERNTKLKGSLGRPRHRWGDNIKMDVTEIGCEGVDGIHLVWDDVWWELL
jgi:hypothetical protein